MRPVLAIKASWHEPDDGKLTEHCMEKDGQGRKAPIDDDVFVRFELSGCHVQYMPPTPTLHARKMFASA